MKNLSRLEDTLERISRAEADKSIRDLREKYIRCIKESANIDRLFNVEIPNRKKDFVAISIVRMMCANERAFDSWTNKMKAFELFDKRLDSIYGHYGIQEDDQNYKKQNNLKELENEVRENFEQIKETVESLEIASRVREKIMKSMNYAQHRKFLDLFLNSGLSSNERIGEVFEALEGYRKSTGIEKVKAFQYAEEVFERYIEDLKKSKSNLNNICLKGPIEQIYELIKKDFQQSETSKAPSLEIRAAERKYPFNIEGREVEIKFEINNEGGYAFNAKLECKNSDESILIPQPEVPLPDIKPGKNKYYIKSVVKSSKNKDKIIEVKLNWEDYRGKRESLEKVIVLESQQPNLDWDKLSKKSPYSLEPLDNEEDLIGRSNLVEGLFTDMSKESVESYIIFGQKRVGKTSVAESVRDKLSREINQCFTTYQPVGAFNKTDAAQFVSDLGEEIIFDLEGTEIGELSIDTPEFQGSLSPLRKYLRRVHRAMPDAKIIIVVDEFDELPIDLIKYTDIQDSFFHNLRELINLDYVGFMLVGGENMRMIREYSATDRLNKVVNQKVDYLNDWSDFKSLVKGPVKGVLEFEDGAIHLLHDLTEGNPFFTNFICKTIYKTKTRNRISYVTEEDVELAVNKAIGAVDSDEGSLALNNMSHFWIDGTSARDRAKIDEIVTQRKKFLLGYAREKRRNPSLTVEELRDSNQFPSGVPVDQMIESYKQRGILKSRGDSKCHLKPPFFEKWLIESGISQISSRFLDQEAIEEMRTRERDLYVKDEEIVDVLEGWGTYMGKKKTKAHVRKFLNQFEGPEQQRIVFNLTENIEFYDQTRVREAIRTIHSKVKTERVIREGERARRDIILSAFGTPDKSDSVFTGIYKQENQIYHKNIVRYGKISERLKNNDEERAKALVFVDDIFGTGSQKSECLKKLDKEVGDVIREEDIKVYVTAVCGFRKGIKNVKKEAGNTKFECEVYVVEHLEESKKSFSEGSEIFESKSQKRKAKKIAKKYGRNLDKRQPLGYEDNQLLIVFHQNCPNNTLPIFWKDTKDWDPLFVRK